MFGRGWQSQRGDRNLGSQKLLPCRRLRGTFLFSLIYSKSSCICQILWTQDCGHLILATTYPRLKVDNKFKIYSVEGDLRGELSFQDTQLYEVVLKSVPHQVSAIKPSPRPKEKQIVPEESQEPKTFKSQFSSKTLSNLIQNKKQVELQARPLNPDEQFDIKEQEQREKEKLQNKRKNSNKSSQVVLQRNTGVRKISNLEQTEGTLGDRPKDSKEEDLQIRKTSNQDQFELSEANRRKTSNQDSTEYQSRAKVNKQDTEWKRKKRAYQEPLETLNQMKVSNQEKPENYSYQQTVFPNSEQMAYYQNPYGCGLYNTEAYYQPEMPPMQNAEFLQSENERNCNQASHPKGGMKLKPYQRAQDDASNMQLEFQVEQKKSPKASYEKAPRLPGRRKEDFANPEAK